MLNLTINLVAMVIGAIANMIIGAIWYSPMVFGKRWMKYMGINEKNMGKMKTDMTMSYGLTFVGSLFTAFVLYNLIKMATIVTIPGGMIMAILVWIGFMLPLFFQAYAFEKKETVLITINSLYNLVSLVVMGVIFVLM